MILKIKLPIYSNKAIKDLRMRDLGNSLQIKSALHTLNFKISKSLKNYAQLMVGKVEKGDSSDVFRVP